MSLSRLLVLAALLGVAAYQAPQLAPGLFARLAGDAPAGPQDQAPGPARVIAVEQSEPRPQPVSAPPAVAAPTPEPRLPRKIAGGNSSGGVTLRLGRDGHYAAKARINGVPIDMMVDTGASHIALSEATAHRLSIFPKPEDYTAQISTANGVISAAPVMLNEVRVGNISVRQVQAVVIGGEALGANLLGMSFLNRLRFSVGNNEMVLRQ